MPNRAVGRKLVFFFREKPNYRIYRNNEYHQGVAVYWVSSESPRAPTSSCAGGLKALFYGFNMARALKCLLPEIIFGNIGVSTPTYLRIDNSGAAYQVDSLNTVNSENRPGGSLGSNREEIDKNNLLSVGYIPGDMNTSEG